VESGTLGFSETFSAGGGLQPRARSVTTGALFAIIMGALILLIAASILIWLCVRHNIGRTATDSSDLEMAYEVAPIADDVGFRFAEDGGLASTVSIDSETASDGPDHQSAFSSSSEEAAITLAVE
jgi:hypothetical protein